MQNAYVGSFFFKIVFSSSLSNVLDAHGLHLNLGGFGFFVNGED